MEITDIEYDGYERVARCRDEETGLHALIAVHDTTLGPALGGMRMWPYTSEDEALFDVLRLSKGMTKKSAVAETGLGGGKSVIIGDPRKDKSPELFRAMGRFIEALDGKYITAEDMNIGIWRQSGENVDFSRRMLKSSGIVVQKLIVVQKPFMERRAYATLKKRWPEPTVVVSSAAATWAEYPDGSGLGRETILNIMVGDLQNTWPMPCRARYFICTSPSDR